LDSKREPVVSSWGDHPPAEVTLEAAAPAIAVTLGDAPLDPRILVLGDCVQARQEILGVMAGMDGMPHLSCFPDSKVHVLDAFHDLRRALLHIEQAITSITDEPKKRMI